MFRAVLFDLDGTLYDRDAAILRFAHDQHARLGLGKGGMSEGDYARRFVELDARGQVWKDRVYEILAPELGIDISAAELLEDYNERYRDQCLPFEGLEDVLLELGYGGASFGLVTNGLTDFQLRTFESLGVSHFFGAVAVSEREGVRKPDPRIFRRVLDQLAAGPEDAVFVGDDPSADIGGAKAAGMKAVWIETPFHTRPPEADAFITDIRRLPETLWRLRLAS